MNAKKQFQQLRLKLALIYAIIGFLVIACFNLAIIFIFDNAERSFRSAIDSPLGCEVNSLHNSNQLNFCLAGEYAYQEWLELHLNSFSQNFKKALYLFDFLIVLMTVLLGFYYSDYVLRPVEKSIKKQEDFILNASHELKTPIAAISAEIDALRLTENACLTPIIAESLDVICSETKNLHQLSQMMLDLTKVTDDHTKWSLLNLSTLVSEQVRKFKGRAKQKNITLKSKITPDLEVLGADHQLRLMINYLLDNAIKYTPTEGTVEVELLSNKKEIVLRICDNGCGIFPADHRRIFQRFYRAKNKATFTQEGSGLGLSIVAEIIAHHQAQIKVISDPVKKQGTSFEIIFQGQNIKPVLK